MFQDGFPIELSDVVSEVEKIIPTKTYNNVSIKVSEKKIQYLLNGVTIEVPYRIYFLDITDEKFNKLNTYQQMVLHCIYSRSCNGFVRYKHLQALLLMSYEDWTIPYIVKACDEYVVEILEMVYNILKEQDTERFRKFFLENNTLFCRSYARVISYWNEYYRNNYSHFHEYIGSKLFRECFGYTKS